jgi:hypothetical protein
MVQYGDEPDRVSEEEEDSEEDSEEEGEENNDEYNEDEEERDGGKFDNQWPRREYILVQTDTDKTAIMKRMRVATKMKKVLARMKTRKKRKKNLKTKLVGPRSTALVTTLWRIVATKMKKVLARMKTRKKNLKTKLVAP